MEKNKNFEKFWREWRIGTAVFKKSMENEGEVEYNTLHYGLYI